MSQAAGNEADQDELAGHLIESLGTLEEDEFETLFAKLDRTHQVEVEDSIRNYADNAVGSSDWDRD